jgi:hypothetical protein
MPAVLLDTGPWVALLIANDTHHAWAKQQFASHPGPFITCEAVVAEACLLLARSGFDPALPLVFIERGVVLLPFSLQEHITHTRNYDDPIGPYRTIGVRPSVRSVRKGKSAYKRSSLSLPQGVRAGLMHWTSNKILGTPVQHAL